MCEPINRVQVQEPIKHLFANLSNKDEDTVYPLTISEIAECQKDHKLFRKYFKDKLFKDKDSNISPKVVTDTLVLLRQGRLVIPTAEICILK